jgi:hypothetical protein
MTRKRTASRRSTGKRGTTFRTVSPCNLQHAHHGTYGSVGQHVTSKFCTPHRQKRLAPPGAKRKARAAARGAGASPRGEPSERQIRRSAPAAYALEVQTLTRMCS